MKSCQYENLLVPYMHNELSKIDHQRFTSHLSTCDKCQADLDELKSVDLLLHHYNRDKAPRALYLLYKKQLKDQFKQESLIHTVWRQFVEFVASLFISPSLSFRLARAGAILILGVLLGRNFFYPSHVSQRHGQNVQQYAELTRDDIQFIADYVVKSELLLLTIANSSSDEPSDDDIYLNKDIAQTLLYKTAQVQRKAQALDDDVVFTFLNHLEFVLLEISNRDDEEIRATFRDIKDMINDSGMVQKSRRLQHRLENTLAESA